MCRLQNIVKGIEHSCNLATCDCRLFIQESGDAKQKFEGYI